jgi:small subunit ribosomal protein S2
MTVQVSLKELIESGAHFGHQSRRWNPKMEPYLYGVKEGVHVFDLTITKKLLEEALNELKTAAKEGKTILFLGTKKQVKDKIEKVAKATESFYVNERWLGGTLTNFEQIRKSTKKLTDMKSKMAKGEYDDYTKKERLDFQREIDRLERFFGGIVGMEELPDYLVIIDIKREASAVREAKMTGVSTIAIVDSNCDPVDVDYIIPMNDDATKALEYIMDLMKDAILEGKGKTSSKKKAVGSKGKKATKKLKDQKTKKTEKKKAAKARSSKGKKSKK